MVVRVVEVVEPPLSSTSSTAGSTRVTEVVDTNHVLDITHTQAQVVDIVSGQGVFPAVVSETAPVSPYEGQIWIDVSGSV